MPFNNRKILNPYFQAMDELSSKYKDGMLSAIESLSPYLSEKQIEDFLKNKLQLFSSPFNEPQYLQAACELVICSHLARAYKDAFKYELELNSPKNVDCSFFSDGTQFNIEIKCADYSKSHEMEKEDGFKIGFLGRIPDHEGIFNDLESSFQNHPEGRKTLLREPHMDNKLKDYLLSAHGKFSPQPREDHLNILAICCDTPLDIQKWFGYMYENQGLFTNESFFNKNDYNLVDVVFITNLYHRHHSYNTKEKITDHWHLDRSFNLIFSNPYRCLDKRFAIELFVRLMPNYSNDLLKYQVPGDVEEYVKNSIKIPHFVGDELQSKGIFLFQPNQENI